MIGYYSSVFYYLILWLLTYSFKCFDRVVRNIVFDWFFFFELKFWLCGCLGEELLGPEVHFLLFSIRLASDVKCLKKVKEVHKRSYETVFFFGHCLNFFQLSAYHFLPISSCCFCLFFYSSSLHHVMSIEIWGDLI